MKENKRLNKKSKKASGITLIALVITIIILLILAGVAIASLSGDNGLLNNSAKAKEEAVKAQLKEEIEMAIMDIQAGEIPKGNDVTLESLAGQEDDDNVGQLENNIDLQKGDITADLVENEIIGEYKGYNYKIDGNLNVIIEDKATEENLRYGAYIRKHIKVDKIIYINSAIGDDETGNGTESTPYKTLDKITEAGIIENDKTYAVMLMDGEYTLTESIFTLQCNKSINIFGNKQNTIIKLPASGIGSNAGGGGTDKYSLNFYRLIMELENTFRNNYWSCENSITFNNIVFKLNSDKYMYSFIGGPGKTREFKNCISVSGRICVRCDTTSEKLTNCYGNFVSGYSTQDSQWKDETDYITSTPKVDNTTYRITDDESVWKDKGTGTDPDGSVADLGVYGGEYSWKE